MLLASLKPTYSRNKLPSVLSDKYLQKKSLGGGSKTIWVDDENDDVIIVVDDVVAVVDDVVGVVVVDEVDVDDGVDDDNVEVLGMVELGSWTVELLTVVDVGVVVVVVVVVGRWVDDVVCVVVDVVGVVVVVDVVVVVGDVVVVVVVVVGRGLDVVVCVVVDVDCVVEEVELGKAGVFGTDRRKMQNANWDYFTLRSKATTSYTAI